MPVRSIWAVAAGWPAGNVDWVSPTGGRHESTTATFAAEGARDRDHRIGDAVNRAHREDHQLITEAIEQDWLDRDRLLVHLAREHGFKVSDVANYGMVPLSEMHNDAHAPQEVIPYVSPLQRIANTVAARIESGEIPPGAELSPAEIAEMFEISTRHAKHVLGHLRADGFVQGGSAKTQLPPTVR